MVFDYSSSGDSVLRGSRAKSFRSFDQLERGRRAFSEAPYPSRVRTDVLYNSSLQKKAPSVYSAYNDLDSYINAPINISCHIPFSRNLPTSGGYSYPYFNDENKNLGSYYNPRYSYSSHTSGSYLEKYPRIALTNDYYRPIESGYYSKFLTRRRYPNEMELISPLPVNYRASTVPISSQRIKMEKDLDLYTSYTPPSKEYFATMRHNLKDLNNKMTSHRSMLDRYADREVPINKNYTNSTYGVSSKYTPSYSRVYR